jgi:hypothetical protein
MTPSDALTTTKESPVNYENFLAVLGELGEKELRIRKAVVLKLGCLLIAQQPPPDGGPFPISDRDRMPTNGLQQPLGQLAKDIFEALKQHPNIFDVQAPVSWDHLSFRGGRFGMIVDGPIVSFRVHLPKAQHKYQDMDCEEHFSVFSNGSTYAAFSTIKDIPCWTNIGHEYRELAQAQIEKCTSYKSQTLGPCPIHPIFRRNGLTPPMRGVSRIPNRLARLEAVALSRIALPIVR